MGRRDPRVDKYIEKSADFAKPILERLRECMHEDCPDVEETIKWGMPHFTPSKKREYVEWLTEAKTDATREKRLATSIEWLAAGRARYWKYEKC